MADPDLSFRWRRSDGDVTRIRLLAHAGCTRLLIVRLVARTLALVAALIAAPMASILTALRPLTALLLVLLGGLVHRIQDAEIVFGVLEIALCHDAVATARRIPSQLEVFLEQLLRRAANAEVRAGAVEHVVPVERNVSSGMVANGTATSTATTSAAST